MRLVFGGWAIAKLKPDLPKTVGSLPREFGPVASHYWAKGATESGFGQESRLQAPDGVDSGYGLSSVAEYPSRSGFGLTVGPRPRSRFEPARRQ